MRYLTSMAIAAITLAACVSAASAEPPNLSIGQPFPAIAFPSMEDGSPMSIADFRGEKVILHVFASW